MWFELELSQVPEVEYSPEGLGVILKLILTFYCFSGWITSGTTLVQS